MTRHPGPDFRIAFSDGEPPVMSLSGELDIASAPALRQTLLDMLPSMDGHPLAVDASGLTFVDSTGLSVLLMGTRRYSDAQKHLLLRAPSRALTKVIELTGVRAALEFEE